MGAHHAPQQDHQHRKTQGGDWLEFASAEEQTITLTDGAMLGQPIPEAAVSAPPITRADSLQLNTLSQSQCVLHLVFSDADDLDGEIEQR